jgi:hypothetical protein
MGDTTKDFEELFALFGSHRVKAVVVGAHAVAFHAKPRYTKDIDILVEPSTDNADRLIGALEEFGFAGVGLTRDDFARPGVVVQLGHPPNRIDLMTSVDGVTFEEVWGGRVRGSYGKVSVDFVGLNELIRNKKASGRPQDLADLSWLERREPDTT